MSGIVYLLTNPYYTWNPEESDLEKSNLKNPALVKIGCVIKGDTKRDLEERMKQLQQPTGVPGPFVCELAVKVEDAQAVEKVLHQAFEPYCTRGETGKPREFFEIDIAQAEGILLLLGDDITPSDKEQLANMNAKDKETIIKYRERRPNMNFLEMGIEVGSVLHFISTDDTVEVAGPRSVLYQGEEMAITRATKKIRDDDSPVSPAHLWRYNGRLLRDIYEETQIRLMETAITENST